MLLSSNTAVLGTPSPVVVLNIFNTQQYPVTLDAIYALTSYIGPVNRILLFDKDGHTNALVEYAQLEHAIKAQKVLYRHHLWNNNSGLILTAFSKQQQLTLNPANSARSRDYTLPMGMQAQQMQPNFPGGAPAAANTPYALAAQAAAQVGRALFVLLCCTLRHVRHC
jgi:hypothetical protein